MKRSWYLFISQHLHQIETTHPSPLTATFLLLPHHEAFCTYSKNHCIICCNSTSWNMQCDKTIRTIRKTHHEYNSLQHESSRSSKERNKATMQSCFKFTKRKKEKVKFIFFYQVQLKKRWKLIYINNLKVT